jgi:hypothetical protein
MQEFLLPHNLKEVPPFLQRVPISLQKYYRCIQNNGLINSPEESIENSDEMIHTIFNYADPDEKIALFIQEYAHQCIIRPNLYIPLIINGYKDPLLHGELLIYDPHIRGTIIGSANSFKAELETTQAKFSLGVSALNELDPEDAQIELGLLTKHIAFLHNLNVELLYD